MSNHSVDPTWQQVHKPFIISLSLSWEATLSPCCVVACTIKSPLPCKKDQPGSEGATERQMDKEQTQAHHQGLESTKGMDEAHI